MGVLPIGKNPHHFLYPFALGASFQTPNCIAAAMDCPPYPILGQTPYSLPSHSAK